MLWNNYCAVREEIDNACVKSLRKPEDVCLIAVSKTKPASMIQELYDKGVRDFGENYVQELVEKYEVLPKDIRWHMIGHLQRNKVKYIIDKVTCIHSVDSVRLAEEIDKEAKKHNLIMDILVEINVAGEENKFGMTCEAALDYISEISSLNNIRIRGLMTSAPFVENCEDNRIFFRKLKQLCVDIKDKNIDNVVMDNLSMGMTNDFVVAVEEGSTYVRVGTAIFGNRIYKK